jgi:hypothetical protein
VELHFEKRFPTTEIPAKPSERLLDYIDKFTGVAKCR